MGIVKDILDVIMDGGQNGVIISAICHKANLSHYTVFDKCENFITAGLIHSIKNDKNRIYLMTEKGIKFFQELQKFLLLTESTNLRV